MHWYRIVLIKFQDTYKAKRKRKKEKKRKETKKKKRNKKKKKKQKKKWIKIFFVWLKSSCVWKKKNYQLQYENKIGILSTDEAGAVGAAARAPSFFLAGAAGCGAAWDSLIDLK